MKGGEGGLPPSRGRPLPPPRENVPPICKGKCVCVGRGRGQCVYGMQAGVVVQAEEEQERKNGGREGRGAVKVCEGKAVRGVYRMCVPVHLDPPEDSKRRRRRK